MEPDLAADSPENQPNKHLVLGPASLHALSAAVLEQSWAAQAVMHSQQQPTPYPRASQVIPGQSQRCRLRFCCHANLVQQHSARIDGRTGAEWISALNISDVHGFKWKIRLLLYAVVKLSWAFHKQTFASWTPFNISSDWCWANWIHMFSLYSFQIRLPQHLSKCHWESKVGKRAQGRVFWVRQFIQKIRENLV